MHQIDSISNDDKLILEKSLVFKGISLNELEPFIKACQVRRYIPGQAILSAGGLGDGLYVVLDGKVDIFLPHGNMESQKSSNEEYKMNLAILEAGEFFGEYSLVDLKRVSASVDALTTVRLFHLSTSDFHRLTKEYLRFENIIYKNILKLLVSRCREANQELDEDVFFIF